MGSPDRDRLDERIGQSLRARRWVWFGGTVVAFVLLWSSGTDAFADNEHESWADWVTLAFMAYALITVVFLVPRFVIPRAEQQASANRLAVMRWAFAVAPFLVGFALFGAGAHAWAMAVAVGVSTLALAFTAMTLPRD